MSTTANSPSVIESADVPVHCICSRYCWQCAQDIHQTVQQVRSFAKAKNVDHSCTSSQQAHAARSRALKQASEHPDTCCMLDSSGAAVTVVAFCKIASLMGV